MRRSSAGLSVRGIGELAFVLMAVVVGSAQDAGIVSPTNSAPIAEVGDCSVWALDGYRVGMTLRDILAVRPAVSYVDRQYQAIVRGKLHGVLLLGWSGDLEKWDVVYDDVTGDTLRAALEKRFGSPTSETVTHSSSDRATDIVERKVMWTSIACDAAIIVDEQAGQVQGVPTRRVGAILVRATSLEDGLKLKTSKFE